MFHTELQIYHSFSLAETREQKEKKLVRRFITVTPNKFVKVPAKQCTEFTIKFAPIKRISPFIETVRSI